MNDKEFQEKTLKAISELHSLVKQLTNQDYCNQALLMALAEQPGLSRQKLTEDYEAHLLHILEQIHPRHQDREIYERFAAALRLQPDPLQHDKPGQA